MNVRKPARLSELGYPSLRQFAKSARRFGLAALGAGAVGASSAAESVTPRLGGTPPPPKKEANNTGLEAAPPRLPGSMPPPRLLGKIAVEPKTNTTATAYVVKEGDTLTGIASRLLGSAARWSEIEKSNPGLTPEKLSVGQKLIIPAAAERKAR